jgi:N-acetylglucosaminyldiphosphoundecaprenol N-acetyl-beta-D-mannosaminyltransferase
MHSTVGAPRCVRVLNLTYSDLSVPTAAKYILSHAGECNSLAVFTPGATVAAAASRDSRLASLLDGGDLLLPDGVGCPVAARLCGERLKNVTPGISLGEALMPLAAQNGMRVFFYGGEEGIAEQAAAHFKNRYPNLEIACASGFGADPAPLVRAFAPGLVFVCLGFPRQEKWILAHKEELSCPCLGLGGSFDVWSGKLRRAPRLVRRLRLEWLYRTLKEPRRIPRLFPLPLYFARCACQGARKLLQTLQKRKRKGYGDGNM